MKGNTLLREVCRAYVNRNRLKPASAKVMLSTVNALSRWAGQDVTLGACTADFINQFIEDRRASVSKYRLRAFRSDILRFLRFAVSEGWRGEVPDVPYVERRFVSEADEGEADSLRRLLKLYLRRQLNIRDGSGQALKYTVSVLDRSVKGGVTLPMCTSDFLCDWLREEMKVKSKAVKHYRGNILTLLRFAVAEGLLDELPNIPTIRQERKNPGAWTVEEVGQIIRTAFALEGKMRHLPITRAWWFGSLLLFLYDTGTRIRSALSLRCKDVILQRGVAVLGAGTDKTWQDRVVALSPELVKLLHDGNLAKRDLVWPWPWAKRDLWKHLAEIQNAAGLPTGRAFSFHNWRRAHATAAVKAAGWAAASRSLGHSSISMTEKYVDRSQVNDDLRIDLPRPQIQYVSKDRKGAKA